MADFDPCFEKVIIAEGGYQLVNDPSDSGGMTYAGIARQRWPDWAGWSKIDAKEYESELTGMVRDFYRQNFWNHISGDDIHSQNAAYYIYDFAVNAGVKTAVRILQQVINCTPDGIFGAKTLAAVNSLISDKKDERIFIVTYALFKIFRYKNICLHDKRRKNEKFVSDEKFLCGWINRVEEGL